MTIIEQIKAEVEKRIEFHDSLASNAESEMIAYLEIGAAQALDDLLSFLSTLESEKPMNQEGLEEEVKAWHKKHFKSRNAWEDYSGHYLDKNSQLDLARHFAKWGAEQMKEQMMKEAVEADVFGENYGSHRKVISEWLEPEIGNPGDKVRIIIVKED